MVKVEARVASIDVQEAKTLAVLNSSDVASARVLYGEKVSCSASSELAGGSVIRRA